MSTHTTKKSDIKRKWHLIDLDGQILGRASSKIAQILIGKNKVYFANNLDCGDYVVAINASKIKVTGKKRKNKIYFHHTGYPSGLREYSFEQVQEKDPSKIILRSVKNMLPKNKLRKNRLVRLRVFSDDKHTYQDKIKNVNNKL